MTGSGPKDGRKEVGRRRQASGRLTDGGCNRLATISYLSGEQLRNFSSCNVCQWIKGRGQPGKKSGSIKAGPDTYRMRRRGRDSILQLICELSGRLVFGRTWGRSWAWPGHPCPPSGRRSCDRERARKENSLQEAANLCQQLHGISPGRRGRSCTCNLR